MSITIEQFQAVVDSMFPGLMGVQLTAVALDKISATMRVRPDMCTSGKTLHGGAFMAFADTLGAIGTVANLGPGKRTVTTDSNTHFIGSAPVDTTVTGESVALHRGRTTQVWQTTVRAESGKVCAVVVQTQIVLDA